MEYPIDSTRLVFITVCCVFRLWVTNGNLLNLVGYSNEAPNGSVKNNTRREGKRVASRGVCNLGLPVYKRNGLPGHPTSPTVSLSLKNLSII